MKHKILIIEDDITIQQQLKNLLTGNGYAAEGVTEQDAKIAGIAHDGFYGGDGTGESL